MFSSLMPAMSSSPRYAWPSREVGIFRRALVWRSEGRAQMNRQFDTSPQADVMPGVSGRSPRRRVVLAEDYDGVRTAMTRLLGPVCDIVGCVSDGAAVLDAIERFRAE